MDFNDKVLNFRLMVEQLSSNNLLDLLVACKDEYNKRLKKGVGLIKITPQ